jgi:hypothetical protein
MSIHAESHAPRSVQCLFSMFLLPGLARLYLERLLLPRLSAGSDEGDEAMADNPMAHVKTRNKTEAGGLLRTRTCPTSNFFLLLLLYPILLLLHLHLFLLRLHFLFVVFLRLRLLLRLRLRLRLRLLLVFLRLHPEGNSFSDISSIACSH